MPVGTGYGCGNCLISSSPWDLTQRLDTIKHHLSPPVLLLLIETFSLES